MFSEKFYLYQAIFLCHHFLKYLTMCKRPMNFDHQSTSSKYQKIIVEDKRTPFPEKCLMIQVSKSDTSKSIWTPVIKVNLDDLFAMTLLTSKAYYLISITQGKYNITLNKQETLSLMECIYLKTNNSYTYNHRYMKMKFTDGGMTIEQLRNNQLNFAVIVPAIMEEFEIILRKMYNAGDYMKVVRSFNDEDYLKWLILETYLTNKENIDISTEPNISLEVFNVKKLFYLSKEAKELLICLWFNENNRKLVKNLHEKLNSFSINRSFPEEFDINKILNEVGASLAFSEFSFLSSYTFFLN